MSVIKLKWSLFKITLFATMSCETFNQDLEMINAGCCSSDSPLNSQFLLSAFEEDKLCPRFYGKTEGKQKVYHALKNDMHAEVQTKWGDLRCHCSRIPILRLSKTARNLNKVFLTCGTPASAETRCKYFQWIHTSLFIDKRPIHKFKYATNLREQNGGNNATDVTANKIPKLKQSRNSNRHG